jgi:hypothetical protein
VGRRADASYRYRSIALDGIRRDRSTVSPCPLSYSTATHDGCSGHRVDRATSPLQAVNEARIWDGVALPVLLRGWIWVRMNELVPSPPRRHESGCGPGPRGTYVQALREQEWDFGVYPQIRLDTCGRNMRCLLVRSPQDSVYRGMLDNLLGTGSPPPPIGHGRQVATPGGVRRASGGARRGRQMSAWGAEAERTCCRASFIHIHRDFDTTYPSGWVVSIWGESALASGGKSEGGC